MKAWDSMTTTSTAKDRKSAKAAKALLLAAAATLSVARVGEAASLYWDADGAGTATGGTGTWDFVSALWRDGSTAGTLGTWSNGNDAFFPTVAGAVTVASPVSFNSLNFVNGSGSYTFSGASMTVGTGGIVLVSGGPTGGQFFNNVLTGTNIDIIKSTAGGSNMRIAFGGANTFTGDINVSGTATTGTANMRIDLNHLNALPAGSDINFYINRGTILGDNGNSVIDTTSQVNFNAAGVGTFEGFVGANTGDSLTINGPMTGNANVNFQIPGGGGNGQIFLGGNSTYTGDTIMNQNAAASHVHLAVSDALPTTTNLQFGLATGTFGGGALNLAGFNQSLNSLKTGSNVTGVASAGVVSTGAVQSTLTITGNQTTTYNSTIGTPVITTSNLTPAGPGLNNIALVLSNAHSGSLALQRDSDYLGGTTINGGTLLANNPGPNSATGSGPVVVNSGGVIGGTGRIAGNVTLNSGGAKFEPGGDNAAEDIDLGNGLTIGSGSILDFDFSPTLKDKINVTGGLTLPGSGTVTVNIGDLGGISNGTYTLISYSGALTGSFGTLALGTQPGGATYQLINAANAVNLQITGAAASLIWNGVPNGDWEVGGDANWAGPATYSEGAIVNFTDAATGTTSITVQGGGVSPLSVNFNNNSKNYTIGGGSINGSGGLSKQGTGSVTLTGSNGYTGTTSIEAGTLSITTGAAIGSTSAVNISNNAVFQASGNVTTDRQINLGTGGGTIDVTGSNNMEVSTAIVGSTAFTKTGTGRLELSASAASAFTGSKSVNGGTLAVSAVDANGVSGVGTATPVNVNSGGTFEIENVRVGFQNDGTTPGTGLTVIVNDGGTLAGTGPNAGISGSNQWANSGNLTLSAPSVGDRIVTGNSVRNVTAGTSSAVITVTGAGTVQIASGGTSTSNAGTQFSGSWVVNMNQNTGVMSVGPILTGGFGEVLNGLGYQPPNPSGSGAYNGETRPVTVTSGTLAFGADAPNTRGAQVPSVVSYRSPLTLNGGKIASTGQQYVTQDPTGGPVTANLHGSISTNPGTTSTVLLYDPVGGAVNGPRDLNIMTDANATTPNVGPVPNGLSWGAGSTLVVDSTGTSGGTLRFQRTTTGNVTVGAGATLQINAGSTVELDGTQDALSDGANHVDVLNNSTTSLKVKSGTKNVGGISGVGNTTVDAGATLVARHIRQNALTLNGNAQVRANSTSTGTSKVNDLTMGAGAEFDLTDNKLIVSDPIGSWNGSAYTGVSGLVDSGRGNASNAQWDGAGIVTSDTRAVNNNDLVSIGTAKVGAFRAIADGATTTFGGQTVLGSDSVAMVTWGGDATLDGKINIDDYGRIDFNVGSSGSVFGWYNGDFNYDGKINIDDYGIIDFNVNAQNLVFPSAGAAGGAGLDGVAAVPEPGAIGVIGLAATGLLARRRRSAK